MKKSVLIICAAVFILVVGTGIIAPLLAPYAEHIGSTGFQVGLLFSGFYMVRLITGTYIGKLADKRGPKAILTYSLILYPIISTLYALSSSYTILFSARLLHGLASAMMLPMVMTYMGQISPKGQEGRYMGIYNTVLFVANSVGPLIGGLITDKWGYRLAFLTLFVLSIISLILVFVLPSSEALGREKKEENKKSDRIKIWKNKKLLALGGINIIEAILIIFLASFFVIILTEKGFDKTSIGFLITVQNLIIGATQVPLGRLIEAFDNKTLIIISGVITIIAILALRFISHYWLITVIFIIIGLALAIILAASSSLAAVLGKTTGMGQTMGFLGSATSLGYVIGPTVLGLIADYFKQEASFYFIGVAWIIGIVMFSVLFKTNNVNLSTGSNSNNIEKII
jgi:Arabinose efflux permease